MNTTNIQSIEQPAQFPPIPVGRMLQQVDTDGLAVIVLLSAGVWALRQVWKD